MARHCTLLCIHRDPARLSLLEENGYELVTATNGYDGLQLFMSRCVDAIVLEYPLGVLNGSIITTEIKHVRPKVPIVMLADHAELPDAVLKSVDAVVHISDPAHILWAVVHFLLSVVPAECHEANIRSQMPLHRPCPGRSRKPKYGRTLSWVFGNSPG